MMHFLRYPRPSLKVSSQALSPSDINPNHLLAMLRHRLTRSELFSPLCAGPFVFFLTSQRILLLLDARHGIKMSDKQFLEALYSPAVPEDEDEGAKKRRPAKQEGQETEGPFRIWTASAE